MIQSFSPQPASSVVVNWASTHVLADFGGAVIQQACPLRFDVLKWAVFAATDMSAPQEVPISANGEVAHDGSLPCHIPRRVSTANRLSSKMLTAFSTLQ